LSIADALGIAKAEESLLQHSDSGSLLQAASLAAPAVEQDCDGFIFNLTLRVADGAEIGLTTSHGAVSGPVLQIQQVLPGGAAEAWNRQCSTSGAAERVLLPGDQIVGVNDVSGDAQAMVQEMESRRLIRLQIVRTRCPSKSSPSAALPVPTVTHVSPAVGAAPPGLPPSPAVALPALAFSHPPPPPCEPPTFSPSPSGGSKLRVDADVFVPMSACGGGVCATGGEERFLQGCDLDLAPSVVDSPEGRRLIESML
jgi:hypothetical protein